MEPGRSRPGGCRRRRAARPGSRARCSGGRRRAGRSCPPGRAACRAARRARRSARPSAGASRSRSAAGRRSASSSSVTRSAAGMRTSRRARRPPSQLERQASAARLSARRTDRRQRPLGRSQLLPRHHALGELDEVVVDGAVGHPGAPASGRAAARRGGRSARTAAAPPRPRADLAAGRPYRRSARSGRTCRQGSPTSRRSHARGNQIVTGRDLVLHEPARLQGDPDPMNDMSRADLHVHSSASAVSKLGVQRSLRIPECATDPLEVYELAKAPGHGLRDDHRPRHDRRRACRSITCPTRSSPRSSPPDSRASRRPCTSSATASPRSDHEWLQAHRDDVETCAAYLQRARDHRRARPPVLCRGRAAHRAPPATPGRAVPDLGDPERLARQGTESAGVRVHRDPRGNRDRGVR